MSMSGPIQSAYETFEAARLEYVARYDHATTVCRTVDAELEPQPKYLWTGGSTRAEEAERSWWLAQHRRRVTARLGVDSDEFCRIHRDRMECAYKALADIPATTTAELLCQTRAWRDVNEDLTEERDRAEAMVGRLYRDLERLAGEARL